MVGEVPSVVTWAPVQRRLLRLRLSLLMKALVFATICPHSDALNAKVAETIVKEIVIFLDFSGRVMALFLWG